MIISSLIELNNFAKHLLSQWYHKFLLEWELGVGKTQFTKEIVSLLWWNKDNVQSPTYTYMNIYNLSDHKQMLHIDLYRFEDKEDAFNKGIFEAIDEHDIICIERPKREEEYTDPSWVRLQFSFTPDGQRNITIWQ
jgi:tRNA threonylcarbamoyladenosine biosynthesis protein TsaE